MPDLTPVRSVDISKELDKLAYYKYHPNGILNVSLNRLQDMLDGKIEVVDPSNPFIYLLETSSLNTAFAIQEYTLLTRKLYPRLANNEDDLYLHMSDVDYLGRFAEPASAIVKFNILFSDFQTRAKYDPIQREHTLTLPRHLKVSVDKYIFTLQTAIVIRLTESGVIDIKFKGQDIESIFPVETNYINFNMTSFNQNETYLNFEVKLPEVDLEVVEIPTEKGKLFKGKINFHPNRNFYYFRCFHLLDGKWEEMIVTHTDQVYDVYKPTCSIKVNQINKEVEYYIPPVYVNTDRLGSKVKFIAYTTLGPINVNFGDYKISDFSVEYNQVFPEIELDATTEPLQLVSKVIYISDKVVEGKAAVGFQEIKQAVIDNSIGDRKLPITNKQLDYFGNQNNFRVIRDVDVVTNRVFLLECDVPNSPTRYPITKFNMDLMEFKSSLSDIHNGKNNVTKVNNSVTILPEGTLFEIKETGLHLLDQTEYESIISKSNIELTTELNSKRYISLYYHYVLDTSNDTTTLRAYDLSTPSVDRINFKDFNSTGRVGINTTNTNLVKTESGYQLDILSNLKKYIESINETNVKPYIVYRDNNDSVFYLESRLFTTIGENPVYRFDIVSDYFIDSTNKMLIKNFKDLNGNFVQVSVGLESDLDLIYVSNIVPSRYEATSIDEYIYGSYLAVDRAVVTLENLNVKFGNWLEYLYSRVHTSTGVFKYEVWEEDVIKKHDSIVYNENNEIVFMPGDEVLDNEGNVVYECLKGEVKIGVDGNPIPINELELERYMNLLFIDYRSVVANKTLIKEYKKYLKEYLTEKCVENAKNMQSELLENTVGYMTVPKNLDNVKVKHSGKISYIKSSQKFKVMVYVSRKVYEDIGARNEIEKTIIGGLEEYLYENTKLSKTVLLNRLYEVLKEFVNGISIDSFTELDEEYMEIEGEGSRIGLNKILTVDPEGYDLKEAVVIEFILV